MSRGKLLRILFCWKKNIHLFAYKSQRQITDDTVIYGANYFTVDASKKTQYKLIRLIVSYIYHIFTHSCVGWEYKEVIWLYKKCVIDI